MKVEGKGDGVNGGEQGEREWEEGRKRKLGIHFTLCRHPA